MNAIWMQGNILGRVKDFISSEIQAFEPLIFGFTGGIIRKARETPEDKRNWSFTNCTPTAKDIREHAWFWLWNDQQEITVLDPARQILCSKSKVW